MKISCFTQEKWIFSLKKQHWSGLFFRPSPDIHTIEISEKLSFPVFLAEFYENIWVLLENLEQSFLIPGTEIFDFAKKTSL